SWGALHIRPLRPRPSASNPHYRFGSERLHSAAAGIPRLNSIGLAFHSGSSREPRFAAARGEPSFHFQKFEAEISGPRRSVEPSFHFQKLKLRSPAAARRAIISFSEISIETSGPGA